MNFLHWSARHRISLGDKEPFRDTVACVPARAPRAHRKSHWSVAFVAVTAAAVDACCKHWREERERERERETEKRERDREEREEGERERERDRERGGERERERESGGRQLRRRSELL